MHDPNKRKVVKSLVRKKNLHLVYFQETKIKEMFIEIVRSLSVGKNLGCVSMDVKGTIEGVLLSWDTRALECLNMEAGFYSISCRFRNCEDGFLWLFTKIYGLVKGKERREMWEELAPIKGLLDEAWCLCGDFNAVHFPIEKRNCRQMSTTMREFSSFIEEFQLANLPLGGGNFTWCGE